MQGSLRTWNGWKIGLGGVMLLAMALSPQIGHAQTAPTGGQPAAAQHTLAPGMWDGTASGALTAPYADTTQSHVPFGVISYFDQPWRSYVDTMPDARFSDSLGVNWSMDQTYVEPIAQVLQTAGVSAARIEIGWSNLGWNDTLTPAAQTKFGAILTSMQRHHIRPLILLNANAGLPCPTQAVPVQLAQAAHLGDTTLKLANAGGVVPGYTGIQYANGMAAYPTITAVDPDGTAHLSAPMPLSLSAGPLTLIELKYKPFQGILDAGGAPVPGALDTFNGWVKYIAAVGSFARQALGTAGQADSGFDLEVWNELSFGSNFLNINNYYTQPFTFSAPFTYTATRPAAGLVPGAATSFTATGAQAILPITVDYFNNPTNGFHGVRTISGFSNQEPFSNGTTLWPGQAGFSRHCYTGGIYDCTPASPLAPNTLETVNAMGTFDGTRTPADWATIVPGTNFVPSFRVSMPEWWYTGYVTEGVWRDLVPDDRMSYFSGGGAYQLQQHGRFTHNGDLHPAQVWMTETNYGRDWFMAAVRQQANVPASDPGLLALDDWLTAKTLLRNSVMQANKGLYRECVFTCTSDPYDLGVLTPKFMTALQQSHGVVTPAVQAAVPMTLQALQLMTSAFAVGSGTDAPRPLTVQSVVEYQPRIILAGDGTAAHPNRYDRDQFAFLPFQANAKQFLIPYYVATPDLTYVWDADADVLDPKRYTMPDQAFDVTIKNVNGLGAQVVAVDPLTRATLTVPIVSATATTLTVHLAVSDYPRLLRVTEAQPGPQISAPSVTVSASGQVTVSYATNIPVQAQITYGSGWTNRSAHVITVAGTDLHQSVTLPAQPAGVTAVRISVTSNGVTDVWPHWDEDPAGQVVIPASGH